MTKIGIIIGSTRPGRNGEAVARWVYEQSKKRNDATFELIDLADYQLPLLDEPYPAMMHQYTKDHTKKWSAKIAAFDGFIFVTPEYNHTTSGALKNAIDYLSVEWKNKAVGFVSYGAVGGVRAAEALRLIVGALDMAPVSAQVTLSLFTDFVKMTDFRPADRNVTDLTAVVDQVIAWTNALSSLRK